MNLRSYKSKALGRLAFIGTYVPRRCGIATFTHDLLEAVALEAGDVSMAASGHAATRAATGSPPPACFAVALNDQPEGYRYPYRVRFELTQNDLSQYHQAADFLNISNPHVVCVQHEFGIYGGVEGSHILSLIRNLRMPVVTTLHTVLKDPNENQLQVMRELIRISDYVVSMSQRGIGFLRDIYKAPEEKLMLIHHGIPDVPFVDPNYYKDELDVPGRRVILTFGLLSPNKGIEYMIDALPRIVKKYPDVVYIVLGATHPHILKELGEDYRLGLQRRARDLEVENNVIFFNRFVELSELCEFIGAADVYVTPYLDEAQITSGTLAYTVGAGKAIVSTPYWYAQELLADGRGLLAPFRDAEALADQIIWLLDNELEHLAIRKSAYQFGRKMVWREVARQYLDVFTRARELCASRPRTTLTEKIPTSQKFELPPLSFKHLRRLTDSTGMLQHAKYTVPDLSEGYSTDDTARALMAVVLANKNGSNEPGLMDLANKYLAFLLYAFRPETGRFRNFLGHHEVWVEEVGSEDSHGRSLHALGTTVAYVTEEGLRGLAADLFDRALHCVSEFKSPRAWAFALLGIHEYLRHFSGDTEIRREREALAKRLYGKFRECAADDWTWCEESLSYANASLTHATIISGRWLQDNEMITTGLKALRWLLKIQTSSLGNFSPVGNNGFMKRGGTMAKFDQQPIEAQTTVEACLEACRITGEKRWLKEARRAFEWFLGRNDLRLPLYDFKTGGCYDGLHPDRVNMNEGAESTLAWILSLLQMQQAETEF